MRFDDLVDEFDTVAPAPGSTDALREQIWRLASDGFLTIDGDLVSITPFGDDFVE